MHRDTHVPQPTPQIREGMHSPWEHSLSLLSFPFPLFLSNILCPALPPTPLDRKGQDSGADCFLNVLGQLSYLARPMAMKASHHSLTIINILPFYLFFFQKPLPHIE